MEAIKDEFGDDEVPLVSSWLRNQDDIPDEFNLMEWNELAGNFMCEQHEIDYIIMQRGQGGSRKGRPTHTKVEYKGPFSHTARAIRQRDLAASRSKEEQALASAASADRAAKYQLKKNLLKDATYAALSTNEQETFLNKEWEKVEAKRFKEKSSHEWLSNALELAHKKWRKIQNELDLRRHKQTLGKLQEAGNSSLSTDSQTRADVRLYGSGGVVEKLLRKVYKEGEQKLQSDSFESQDEKDEWLKFCEGLSKEELAICVSEDWAQRDPTPIQGNEDDAIDRDGLYVSGDSSDECEEEVDEYDDTQIEAIFKENNEYETHSPSESEWEGFSDFGDTEGASENANEGDANMEDIDEGNAKEADAK